MPQRRPSASNRRRSQQLGLQLRCGAINQQFYRKMNGAPARVRTRDPLITNPVVCDGDTIGWGGNSGKVKLEKTQAFQRRQEGIAK